MITQLLRQTCIYDGVFLQGQTKTLNNQVLSVEPINEKRQCCQFEYVRIFILYSSQETDIH